MTKRQKAIALAPELNPILEHMKVERERMKYEYPELVSLVTGDMKALRNLRSLLRQGKPEAAFSRMWKMDTAVRERIPGKVWQFLQQVGSE